MPKPTLPLDLATGPWQTALRRRSSRQLHTASSERNNVIAVSFGQSRRAAGTGGHATSLQQPPAPLTVEQLEEGLRMLERGEIEANLFWDQNVAAFRQTVLLAIVDTSKALSSSNISAGLRAELEGQVKPLNFYLEIANSYIAQRAGTTH